MEKGDVEVSKEDHHSYEMPVDAPSSDPQAQKDKLLTALDGFGFAPPIRRDSEPSGVTTPKDFPVTV